MICEENLVLLHRFLRLKLQYKKGSIIWAHSMRSLHDECYTNQRDCYRNSSWYTVTLPILFFLLSLIMIVVLDNSILDWVCKTTNWIADRVTDFFDSFFDRTCVVHEVQFFKVLFSSMSLSKHLFSEFFATINGYFIKLIDECDRLKRTKLLVVA